MINYNFIFILNPAGMAWSSALWPLQENSLPFHGQVTRRIMRDPVARHGDCSSGMVLLMCVQLSGSAREYCHRSYVCPAGSSTHTDSNWKPGGASMTNEEFTLCAHTGDGRNKKRGGQWTLLNQAVAVGIVKMSRCCCNLEWNGSQVEFPFEIILTFSTSKIKYLVEMVSLRIVVGLFKFHLAVGSF